jgi:folate-binding protein YgfZ
MTELRGLRRFALARSCENIYTTMNIDVYNQIRSGKAGFIEMPRGLIAVWGKEAVQFLDGLITNDMKTLEDGGQMLAAFPNAQGRLLAVVRVLRQGDRFLFETEDATREKVFNNLFRFTYAGDFFVEDLSDKHQYFELIGAHDLLSIFVLGVSTSESQVFEGLGNFKGVFVPDDSVAGFRESLRELESIVIDEACYETLRIENGIPLYGVDMDENTIVPELGLDGLISYNKGCYIGQEIIARIHFRGHVAKQLTGVVFQDADKGVRVPTDLTTADGKNAGRITSVTYSPKLEKTIALGYVRYDFLEPGTTLLAGDVNVEVATLPFK